MSGAEIALILVVLIGGIGAIPVFITAFVNKSGTRKKDVRDMKILLHKQNILLEDIRETCWQYRDIEPVSSTIIIGKIKNFQKSLSIYKKRV